MAHLLNPFNQPPKIMQPISFSTVWQQTQNSTRAFRPSLTSQKPKRALSTTAKSAILIDDLNFQRSQQVNALRKPLQRPKQDLNRMSFVMAQPKHTPELRGMPNFAQFRYVCGPEAQPEMRPKEFDMELHKMTVQAAQEREERAAREHEARILEAQQMQAPREALIAEVNDDIF